MRSEYSLLLSHHPDRHDGGIDAWIQLESHLEGRKGPFCITSKSFLLIAGTFSNILSIVARVMATFKEEESS